MNLEDANKIVKGVKIGDKIRLVDNKALGTLSYENGQVVVVSGKYNAGDLDTTFGDTIVHNTCLVASSIPSFPAYLDAISLRDGHWELV